MKIYGPDLETIDTVASQIESLLKQVPTIKPEAVLADRMVGKPYLEIDIDRDAIARYGIKIAMVQDVIEVAIGGRPITQTVEGRERYGVRVRYQRELRDSIEEIENILVAAPDGTQIPLKELSTINYGAALKSSKPRTPSSSAISSSTSNQTTRKWKWLSRPKPSWPAR